MRTIPALVPAHARCGHCSLPDAMHSPEQAAACSKRLLAELSRSWPRTMQTQAERDAIAVKKLRAAVEALADAVKLVELSPEERAAVLATVDVLGVHLVRRSPRVA